ncbi:threonine ammonia-lyase [Peptococcus simiae]|uniref:threonine ammonia-lyase n=1 Tax=Peptococcus simiae TaxID=1643805 RepID=UPI003980AF2A
MSNPTFDFEAAAHRIRQMLLPTPIIESPYFSTAANNHIFLKPENLQRTGAFKIRGASNKIFALSEEARAKGLVTASAGNHAQGVACAASAAKARAIVVMPETTPLIKINRTKALGAEVRLVGTSYDDAAAEAARLAKEEGFTMVHPFDDLGVIEGQGTIALELLRDLPDLDAILVPVGGGGLIAGIAACIAQRKPDCRVIGVEPKNAASMRAAIRTGARVMLDDVSTIADGTAVKEAGVETYALCRRFVDDWLIVDDFELMEAFTETVEQHKLIVEPSGLLSVAAARKLPFANKQVACILSGGNIDMLMVASMINKGLRSRDRIFKFYLDLPDRPGEVHRISGILSGLRANIISISHDRYSLTERFSNIHVDITVSTNGHRHVQEIKRSLKEAGYQVHDIID